MCEAARHPIQCIIPPYIAQEMVKSPDPAVRNAGLTSLTSGERARTLRALFRVAPGTIAPGALLAAAAAPPKKEREVYDAEGTDQLPGTLKRSEADGPTGDAAIDEAFDYSGDTYDFYLKLFKRNSLDDRGMTLVSSVHVTENGLPMDNAYFNGSQMAYGDGDGVVFQRFTAALDVVGHELTQASSSSPAT